MDSRTCKRLAAAVSVALMTVVPLAAQAPRDAGTGGELQASLKWRPHRAATRSAGPEAAAADIDVTAAAPPRAMVVDTQPAALPQPPSPSVMTPPVATGVASVTLPPDVPRVTSAPARTAAPSPANRVPGPLQRSAGAADPLAFLPQDFTRAPQGEVGRPILEPEGRQAVSMQRRAERSGASPAVRGEAPRFSASRGRGERIAMNADAMPSVLARAPEAAVLQGESVRSGSIPPAGPEIIAPPPPAAADATPFVAESPASIPGIGDEAGPLGTPGDERMLLGQYPPPLHVESFYDDPYEDEDECESPLHHHYGRICGWLRQFGKPYYGWRWYRDFTASAGVVSFTNATDLGINGNYGTNEYLNWAMPMWNAFGIGWQAGARATQSNFQSTSLATPGGTLQKNSRNQVFVTTGFFTRAFEGRGLQGGAVFDYLSDSWFDNTDLAQIRGEISYVWGYHEFGFWSATNVADQIGLFGPVTGQKGLATSVDQYCGFYRLQFGDANEWKVWGGGTGYGSGVVGSLVRAPVSRVFALEGTFTYLIPGKAVKFDADGQGSTYTFAPSAWNVAVNLVYYPAARSRKSLASPYRPLFDVADNGSMIHSIRGLR